MTRITATRTVHEMRTFIRHTTLGIAAAVALTVGASADTVSAAPPQRVALPPLPADCGWLPWYDLMAWWYGQAGYCFQDGHMVFFDWNGNYGTF